MCNAVVVHSFSLPDLQIAELIRKLLVEIQDFDPGSAQERNLIDPFATLLESYAFEVDHMAWRASEHERLRQKNLMNKIGDIHQRIIGNLDGWTSYESGTEMPDGIGVRGRQKILLEVKNKHNTLNASSNVGTYKSLAEKLDEPRYAGYVGILIGVLGPRESRGKFWKPVSATKCPKRNDLIVMNGRTFYAIATDPLMRQPVFDYGPTERLRTWSSWGAIDLMVEQFVTAVGEIFGSEVPAWITDLFPQALSD